MRYRYPNGDEALDLTSAQQAAIDRLIERHPTVLSVPVTVHPGSGCVMIDVQGIWHGIEPDGYTHT